VLTHPHTERERERERVELASVNTFADGVAVKQVLTHTHTEREREREWSSHPSTPSPTVSPSSRCFTHPHTQRERERESEELGTHTGGGNARAFKQP
jgi:hypothetical protein